jgi:hypothetical protein
MRARAFTRSRPRPPSPLESGFSEPTGSPTSGRRATSRSCSCCSSASAPTTTSSGRTRGSPTGRQPSATRRRRPAARGRRSASSRSPSQTSNRPTRHTQPPARQWRTGSRTTTRSASSSANASPAPPSASSKSVRSSTSTSATSYSHRRPRPQSPPPTPAHTRKKGAENRKALATVREPTGTPRQRSPRNEHRSAGAVPFRQESVDAPEQRGQKCAPQPVYHFVASVSRRPRDPCSCERARLIQDEEPRRLALRDGARRRVQDTARA